MCVLCANVPAAAQIKRALLVGIDSYEPGTSIKKQAAAPRENPSPKTAREARGPLPNLNGPVNDVKAIQQILMKRFGFDPKNIHVLLESQATHAAILAAIDNYLLKDANPGDVSVFFYAGHGSRRKNSLTAEPGNLDSTLVPADSYKGEDDILSKELIRKFNHILDKKVILTAIYDSCHSGGITRGLPHPGRVRYVPFDPRDAKDGGDTGPLPQERGALILTAARADESAGEVDVPEPHGVFTSALIAALNRLPPDAPARQVMQEVNALMTVDGPQDQHATPMGDVDRSLFGAAGPSSGKVTLAVMRDNSDGTYELDGGKALQLGPGSELVRKTTEKGAPEVRLRLTKVDALSFSIAEVASDNSAMSAKTAIKQGDLFELVKWVVPEEARLKVWIPKAVPAARLAKLADELAELRKSDRLEWITDPVLVSPTHVLQWNEPEFVLSSRVETKQPGPPENWKTEALGAQITAADLIVRLTGMGSAKPRLFAYLPPGDEIDSGLKIGTSTEHSAVERVALADGPNYMLVGRLGENGVEYAWVQPGVVQDASLHLTASDKTPFCSVDSPLPLRSNWINPGEGQESRAEAARELQHFATQMGAIAALHKLTPGDGGDEFPYKLGLKKADDTVIHDGKLTEGELYDLTLTGDPKKFTPGLHRQFVYVFAIYCDGEAKLWFPRSGTSGEQNRLPFLAPGEERWPSEIPLHLPRRISVSKPFGQDTYFLVTSEEKIEDLSVFQLKAAVTRGGSPAGAAAVLRGLSSPTRGGGYSSSPEWSIQRLQFQSVPQQGVGQK
jgi:hypothetical protein